MNSPQTAEINHAESEPYREVINIIRVRTQGESEIRELVPTYTAVGFAHERVERMLNPGRDVRARRFA